MSEVRYETKTLDDKCVIVSADMEEMVRSLVRKNTATTNVNFVTNEPGVVLDLDIRETLPERASKRPKRQE